MADGRAARNNWWQRSELLALLSAGLALVSWLPQAGAATGTAPVTSPTGGFGIEGDLQANTPTNGIGDWVPGPAGPGGNVLTSAGVPLNSSTTIHVIDLFSNNADDNFGGGDKVNDDPNTWGWVRNPVGAKDDINHAVLHLTTATNGHQWIVVSGDRMSDNGNAYIDFEFLQSSLTLTTNASGTNGGFASTGPHGGRTTNDFILTVALTGGGTTASFFVDQWKAKSGGGFDYFDITTMVPAGAVFAAVNTNDTLVPYGAFGGTTYAKNTFAEAAVDITALIGTAFDPCTSIGVRSILVKTKQF